MGMVAAVAGASGYAGGELLRLLLAHPALEVGPLCAATSSGGQLGDVHPQLPQLAGRPLLRTTPQALAESDVVFLAVPHGQSAPLAAQLPPDLPVIDLAADHRLQAHPPWPYGLPELPGARAALAGARRVAVPGCYATAVALALAPLIRAGAVGPADVVVVAASGTTGAGRSAAVRLLASEVLGGLTPYKVGEHQHVPEIKRATGATSVSMTPVLAPMTRGILATVTARALAGVDPRAVLGEAYADEAFVHLLPAGRQPRTSATLGSNSCQLQVAVDQDSGRVIVTSALDNLGKGAAGQALQCANLVLGLPESAGLSPAGAP